MPTDEPFEVRGADAYPITGFLRLIRSPRCTGALVYAREEASIARLSCHVEEVIAQLAWTYWLVVPFVYLEYFPIAGPEGSVFATFARVHYLWDPVGSQPFAPGVGRFQLARREWLTREEVELLLGQELAPLPREPVRMC